MAAKKQTKSTAAKKTTATKATTTKKAAATKKTTTKTTATKKATTAKATTKTTTAKKKVPAPSFQPKVKFDKELFKRSVLYNVKTLYRQNMEEATPQQIFHHALARGKDHARGD